MIKTRKDLRFYLEEDRKRNHAPKSWWRYYLRLFTGEEQAHIFRYIKCLRHCEYHLNNSSKSKYHKLMSYFYKYRHQRLGLRYHIILFPNTCGYGLRIIHICSGGVGIAPIQCGNYCGFNSGTVVGTKDAWENRPTIGDHVSFGPGAKAFEKSL